MKVVHIRKVESINDNNIKHESIKSVPGGGGANAGKKKKVYRSVISALWKSERATRVNDAEA